MIKTVRIDARYTPSLCDMLYDIWHRRDLVWQFLRRVLVSRYRQTLLGTMWLILQPIISTGILSLVFGRLVGIDSGEIPYPVFVLVGMTGWNLLNRIITDGTGSLVGNIHIISKVYMPLAILPFNSVLVAMVDTAASLILVILLLILYRILPGWQALWFAPAFIGLAVLGLSVSLLLAPLNAFYRDVGFAVPFILQMGLYLTPVLYDASKIPERFFWLVQVNPAAGFIGLARWSLLGGKTPDAIGLGVSVAVTLALFWFGARVFQKHSRRLIDRI